MEENEARRVVDALRERGTNATLARVGVHQFGVSVRLPDGREAVWDSDGTATLEAQVMRDGMLVGFVPVIEGSEDYTEEQVVDAIVRTDYDQPIATRRATAPPLTSRPVAASTSLTTCMPELPATMMRPSSVTVRFAAPTVNWPPTQPLKSLRSRPSV